jgi:hypothetical protein
MSQVHEQEHTKGDCGPQSLQHAFWCSPEVHSNPFVAGSTFTPPARSVYRQLDLVWHPGPPAARCAGAITSTSVGAVRKPPARRSVPASADEIVELFLLDVDPVATAKQPIIRRAAWPPVWSYSNARLIADYLRLFIQITHYGTWMHLRHRLIATRSRTTDPPRRRGRPWAHPPADVTPTRSILQPAQSSSRGTLRIWPRALTNSRRLTMSAIAVAPYEEDR